jgi:probable DNA metabolism protein
MAIIFRYDKSFEGLLTAVFDAYNRRVFPDVLLGEKDIPPLFCDEEYAVITDDEKANRVMRGLERKLSASALSAITTCWLSELPEVDILLFRYIRKAIDSPIRMELNFADEDVLDLAKLWKKVDRERLRIIQFVRFQKAADDTYFAPIDPLYNVLPLSIQHFRDRYADQKWLIYDISREYGYYYDLKETLEVRFEHKDKHLLTGFLDESIMDKDELLFQKMWKAYFKHISISERTNHKQQRSFMPVRFWKYLTEKQE